MATAPDGEFHQRTTEGARQEAPPSSRQIFQTRPQEAVFGGHCLQHSAIQYPSVVTVGIAGEEYVKAELIEGLPSDAAYRHALARLDQHTLVPWDKDADEERLQVHRDGAPSS